MPTHFCEAVVTTNDTGRTIHLMNICGKPATHLVYGNLGREYWVCDHHQKDFAPTPGKPIHIGLLP